MKGQDPSIYHVGPTAQDFYAAFGLGEDDEHINTGDEIGIAFAAIQGLHQVNQEQADQIAELQAQNADLEALLTALEQAVGGRRIPRKPGCSSAGCWWPSSCGSAISLKGEK
jgi:hypothetical protein